MRCRRSECRRSRSIAAASAAGFTWRH
jgi:hypothetical protein